MLYFNYPSQEYEHLHLSHQSPQSPLPHLPQIRVGPSQERRDDGQDTHAHGVALLEEPVCTTKASHPRLTRGLGCVCCWHHLIRRRYLVSGNPSSQRRGCNTKGTSRALEGSSVYERKLLVQRQPSTISSWIVVRSSWACIICGKQTIGTLLYSLNYNCRKM